MRIAPIAGWILTAAVALAPAAAWAKDEPVRVGTAGHTAEWNAEEVAALADNLATAVNDARRTAKRVPSPGVQGGQEVAWFHFNDQLRLTGSEAKQLAKTVRAGATHDQVYPVYQRMWSWIRDAQDTTKRLMIPKEVEAKIQDAGAILDQLDAYFD